jgi:hypothetical protein
MSDISKENPPEQPAPDVSTAMPGENDTDSSVAGAAPDGGALDDLGSAPEPGLDGPAAGSGGDSVAGDEPETLGGPRPDPTEPASKDPSDWVTGDEPMTGPQKSYLDTLAREAGEELPADLTKAEASEHIDRLQQKTGRGR